MAYLSDCIDMASMAAAVTWTRRMEGDTLAEEASWNKALFCVKEWMLKSKTSFYQSTELEIPWWFGLFCFNYTFAGMILWWAKPPWTNFSVFPYKAICIYLIFVQGPLSFQSDYRNMTHESIYHGLDRCSATLMAVLEFWKIYLMWPHLRPDLFRLYMAVVCFSLFSFAKSQQAQLHVDSHGFVVWHNWWHMGALAAPILLAYDRILMEKEGKRKRSV